MSLKAFHLFFIGISIAMSFGFSYWCFAIDPNSSYFVLGVISAVIGISLVVYGRWFIVKYRNLGENGQAA